MKEREIRVVLHDGSEVIMNTGDKVLYQASKPGAIPLAVDADTIADDLILTLEQKDEENKQLMTMSEDWQRQCVQALVERDNLRRALEEAREKLTWNAHESEKIINAALGEGDEK
ncbi:hypothetical protein D3C77_267050 [compost metagenome]